MCGTNSIGPDGKLLTNQQASFNIKEGNRGTFPGYDIAKVFGFKTSGPSSQSTIPSLSSTKESTPSLPKSSGDSGLSIRRSSRSSSNTSNRRGGSRSGARKRYKTT